MEQDTNPMSPSSNLCRSGCGFYGNRANDGFCSKCYKDYLKRKQNSPSSGNTTPLSSGNNTDTSMPSTLAPAEENTSCKDESLDTAMPTMPVPSTSTIKENSCQSSSSETNVYEASAGSVTESENKELKLLQHDRKKNKCNVCKKKLGLTGFQCRCGGHFCSMHRYSNEHDCTFDYKAMGAQEIRRNNPLVVAEKVKKI